MDFMAEIQITLGILASGFFLGWGIRIIVRRTQQWHNTVRLFREIEHVNSPTPMTSQEIADFEWQD